jgi:hypothetical protein
MRLDEYLTTPGSLTVAQLRERIGAKSDLQIRQWQHGYAGRQPGPAHAMAIQQATDGAVRVGDLRPDDWHRIWPMLVGTDGAIVMAPPPVPREVHAIYVAGPMSGIKDHNYPAFFAAALALRQRGFVVENPAENPEPQCKSWQGYMRMAVAQVAKVDAVALLPGWESSTGARVEFNLATGLGLKVAPLDHFLSPELAAA